MISIVGWTAFCSEKTNRIVDMVRMLQNDYDRVKTIRKYDAFETNMG